MALSRAPMLTDAARGAGAGAAATVAMSAWMLLAQRAGAMGDLPPRRITETALDQLGVAAAKQATDALSVLAHLGFGMAVGAVYGVARGRLPGDAGGGLAPVAGAAYGLLVWAASYQGFVPALGALPPASRDRPDRPRSMALAHLVYGGTLGAALSYRRLR